MVCGDKQSPKRTVWVLVLTIMQELSLGGCVIITYMYYAPVGGSYAPLIPPPNGATWGWGFVLLNSVKSLGALQALQLPHWHVLFHFNFILAISILASPSLFIVNTWLVDVTVPGGQPPGIDSLHNPPPPHLLSRGPIYGLGPRA